MATKYATLAEASEAAQRLEFKTQPEYKKGYKKDLKLPAAPDKHYAEVAFQRWAATKTDDDLKQIVFRGQLNRGEVANAIGIGESAVRQNPAIKSLVLKYLGRIAACGERAEPSIEIEATSVF